MKLTASDFYSLHRPYKCPLRVYLRHSGVEESAPGPYEEVVRLLGIRHERAHLQSLGPHVDLSGGSRESRVQRTIEEVSKNSGAIYQPVLKSKVTIEGTECDVIGEPDFLIHSQGQYVVRDSKVSRRITEKDHPEVLLQLGVYRWLYKQTFGRPPGGLQVHAGTGEIVDISYSGDDSVVGALGEVLALKAAAEEPYSPVGWSKCSGCGFHERCWSQAEESKDVALVQGVDQALVLALRKEGVSTIQQLLDSFDEGALSEFKKPHGAKQQRVGKKAASILRFAEALTTGNEIVLSDVAVPHYPNYVMFNLEGLPPQLNETEKIYLWGLQVFGEARGSFLPATADTGSEGDRLGWQRFLENANAVFGEHGDIPFVHWHHYEKTHVKMYVKRYGDPEGIAERVLGNLLDLLPIVQKSLALPLPSYSLKVIERYVGFQRTQDEYGGDWAMAKYIEATETEDEGLRAEVMEKILVYNQEDLEATWAVLTWLKSKVA